MLLGCHGKWRDVWPIQEIFKLSLVITAVSSIYLLITGYMAWVTWVFKTNEHQFFGIQTNCSCPELKFDPKGLGCWTAGGELTWEAAPAAVHFLWKSSANGLADGSEIWRCICIWFTPVFKTVPCETMDADVEKGLTFAVVTRSPWFCVGLCAVASHMSALDNWVGETPEGGPVDTFTGSKGCGALKVADSTLDDSIVKSVAGKRGGGRSSTKAW